MTTAQTQHEATIKLRPGRREDAERLGTICYEAFRTIADQHNFPHDFQSPEAGIGLITMLLGRSDAYSVVAEDAAGLALGSNFLWTGDAVAGVGPITVDPKVQNSSIGRALMEDVIRYADERRFPRSAWCSPHITIARFPSIQNLGSMPSSRFRAFRESR